MSDEDEMPLRGTIKRRLVESKVRAALEKRHMKRTEEASLRQERTEELPPGQRLVEKWPVLDLGLKPDIAPAAWRLTVDGTVEASQAWTWEAFLSLPQSRIVSDIHCVTSWSLRDCHWQGVSAADILSIVRPKPGTRFVLFHSYDGYTTNVSLSRFSAPDVLLAHSWEGQRISPEHGGPVRVVIPALYFWKSAKWIRRIEFAAEDRPGYWEVRGYHNDADPWNEERYS